MGFAGHTCQGSYSFCSSSPLRAVMNKCCPETCFREDQVRAQGTVGRYIVQNFETPVQAAYIHDNNLKFGGQIMTLLFPDYQNRAIGDERPPKCCLRDTDMDLSQGYPSCWGKRKKMPDLST